MLDCRRQYCHDRRVVDERGERAGDSHQPSLGLPLPLRTPQDPAADPADGARSEEHTSELQSLIRISYAVFCLKKKPNTNRKNENTSHNTSTLNITSNENIQY